MHCRKSKQLGASIEDDKLKIGSNFGNLYPVHVTLFITRHEIKKKKEFENAPQIHYAFIQWYTAAVRNHACCLK